MRVLFVSHDASRTGAPILLLRLLEWLKANTKIELTLLLGRAGVLVEQFEAVCPTIQIAPGALPPRRRWLRLPWAVPDGLRRQGRWARLRPELDAARFDVVFVNTSVAGRLLLLNLQGLRRPVVTWVHEMEGRIQSKGALHWSLLRSLATHYLAVSEAVRDNLVVRRGVPKERTTVVHGFLPPGYCPVSRDAPFRHALLSRLGAPADSLLVGACGTLSPGKGPDYFVDVAAAVLSRRPSRPVHFVWIGSLHDRALHTSLRQRIDRGSARGHVHFLGELPDPTACFANLDVFLSPSREDSFPLVIIEAAANRAPVVCFAGSGGAREFVEADAGFVVPEFSCEAMAERTLALLNSDRLRHQLGQNAACKALERHSAGACAPKVAEVLERVAAEPSATPLAW